MAEQGIGGFNIDDDGGSGGGGGTNGSSGSSGTSGNNNTSGSKDKKIKKIYINGGTSDGATGIGNSISGQDTQSVAVVNVGGTSGIGGTSGTSGTSGTGGTSGTSGTSSDDDIKDTPPKLGGNNFQKLEEISLKYLDASAKASAAAGVLAAFPAYKEVVLVYVDEKLGFSKLKDEIDKIAEDNPDITKEELKAEVKKRRKDAIEYYLNEGRDELEQIYNDLKQKVIDFSKEIQNIVKVMVKKIALILTPPVLGTVVPNPITNFWGFIALLYDIKSKLDKIFASILVAIGFIKKLGIYNMDSIKGIIEPFVKQVGTLQDVVGKSLEDKVEEAKNATPDGIAKWEGTESQFRETFDKAYKTIIPGGDEKTGVWCREFAKSRYGLDVPYWFKGGDQTMMAEIIAGSRGQGEIAWAQNIDAFNTYIINMRMAVKSINITPV